MADLVIAAFLDAVLQVALAHGAGGGEQIVDRLRQPPADQEGGDDRQHAHRQGGGDQGVAHLALGQGDGAVRQGHRHRSCQVIVDAHRREVGAHGVFPEPAPAAHFRRGRGAGRRLHPGLIDRLALPVEQRGAGDAVAAHQVVDMHLEQEAVLGKQRFAGGMRQLGGDGVAEAVRLVAHTLQLIVKQNERQQCHTDQDQRRDRQTHLPGHREIFRNIGLDQGVKARFPGSFRLVGR